MKVDGTGHHEEEKMKALTKIWCDTKHPFLFKGTIGADFVFVLFSPLSRQ